MLGRFIASDDLTLIEGTVLDLLRFDPVAVSISIWAVDTIETVWL